MASNFDLDIRNYTIKDVEKLFGMKQNMNYNASDIELKQSLLKEKLVSSGNIDKMRTKELYTFLDDAKKWLIYEYCKLNDNSPTSLTNNMNWDNTHYINSKMDTSRESEIIQRPTTQYVTAFSDEYLAGTINPLNNRVITKCMTIDSKFRNNFYSTQCSDFIIQLPTKLSKVVSMQINSIEFPTVFYSISSSFGNNFFYINATWVPNAPGVDANQTMVVVIPDGNYTPADLITVINSYLSPIKAGGVKTDLIHPTSVFSYIELTLDISPSGSGTGKILIQITDYGIQLGIDIIDITLDFNRDINGVVDNVDITSKLGWNLGFTKSFYSGSNFYQTDTVCDTMKTRYIYLAIDDYNNCVNDHFMSAFNKATINSNIIARISLRGSNYFAIVAPDNLNLITEPRKYFGPVDIQRLHIRLYDEYGRIIQMNNNDFSFCLTFKLLYDL